MNDRYEIAIYWSEEDEAFVAEVPELPGAWLMVRLGKKRSPTPSSGSANGSKQREKMGGQSLSRGHGKCRPNRSLSRSSLAAGSCYGHSYMNVMHRVPNAQSPQESVT